MTDDGIGRVLVASLHQAIGDILPLRLDYYEHWLTPTGLKDGRTGLAPLGAVLSFLRREAPEVYDRVMATAGQHSAEWHYQQGGRRAHFDCCRTGCGPASRCAGAGACCNRRLRPPA
jgi:hypothetical protein